MPVKLPRQSAPLRLEAVGAAVDARAAEIEGLRPLGDRVPQQLPVHPHVERRAFAFRTGYGPRHLDVGAVADEDCRGMNLASHPDDQDVGEVLQRLVSDLEKAPRVHGSAELVHGRCKYAIEIRDALRTAPSELNVFALRPADLRAQLRAQPLGKFRLAIRQRQDHRDLVQSLREWRPLEWLYVPQLHVIRVAPARLLARANRERDGNLRIVRQYPAVRDER